MPSAADQTRQMAQQMSMQGMGGGGMGPGSKQPDMNQLFKEEWEALQVVQHSDTLYKIENDLLHVSNIIPPLTDSQLKKMNW